MDKDSSNLKAEKIQMDSLSSQTSLGLSRIA